MPKTPFGFEAAEQSPGFLLWQTTVTWQRLIKKALEPYNISHAQFVLLANTLWFSLHGAEVTQIDLVKSTKLDKMTVSKSLKVLAVMGLLSRQEHTKDTRAKTVRLTREGQDLTKKLVPIVEEIDEQFFGRFSKSDCAQLIKLLNELVSKGSLE